MLYREILAECKINYGVSLMSNEMRNRMKAAPWFKKTIVFPNSRLAVFFPSKPPFSGSKYSFRKTYFNYSKQMSKPISIESRPEGKVAIRINLGPRGCFRAVLK